MAIGFRSTPPSTNRQARASAAWRAGISVAGFRAATRRPGAGRARSGAHFSDWRVPAGRFVPCRLRTSSSLYPIFVDALNSRCVGAGIAVGGSMRTLSRRRRCGPLRFDAIDAVKHDSQHDRGGEREERNRCCSAESSWIQRSHVHPLAGALTQQFAFAKSVSAFSGLSRQKSGPRREAAPVRRVCATAGWVLATAAASSRAP